MDRRYFLKTSAAMAAGNLLEGCTTGNAGFLEGQRIPDLRLPDIDGNMRSLTGYLGTGKPAVLNFWAMYCGPCLAELPYFHKLNEAYGASINVVTVNQADSPKTVKERITDYYGYKFPVLFDPPPNTTSQFTPSGIPVTYFILPNGTIYRRHRASINYRALVTYVGDMLSQQRS